LLSFVRSFGSKELQTIQWRRSKAARKAAAESGSAVEWRALDVAELVPMLL
jgi:hypothetical protein